MVHEFGPPDVDDEAAGLGCGQLGRPQDLARLRRHRRGEYDVIAAGHGINQLSGADDLVARSRSGLGSPANGDGVHAERPCNLSHSPADRAESDGRQGRTLETILEEAHPRYLALLLTHLLQSLGVLKDSRHRELGHGPRRGARRVGEHDLAGNKLGDEQAVNPGCQRLDPANSRLQSGTDVLRCAYDADDDRVRRSVSDRLEPDREVASLRSCRQTFAESRPDLTSYLHLELVHQACLRDG